MEDVRRVRSSTGRGCEKVAIYGECKKCGCETINYSCHACLHGLISDIDRMLDEAIEKLRHVHGYGIDEEADLSDVENILRNAQRSIKERQ